MYLKKCPYCNREQYMTTYLPPKPEGQPNNPKNGDCVVCGFGSRVIVF